MIAYLDLISGSHLDRVECGFKSSLDLEASKQFKVFRSDAAIQSSTHAHMDS